MKCACCNVHYSLEDVTAMVDAKNALARRVAELEDELERATDKIAHLKERLQMERMR